MARSMRDRFSQPADAFMSALSTSVEADRNIVEQDILGSIAHARMLRRQGLLGPTDLKKILAGLRKILRDWKAGRFTLDPAHEDVHLNVEKALIRLAGPAGSKLHTARSRNDQVMLDMRLWLRDAGREILDALDALRKALARRAREHADTVLPGFTHMQHAQPVVLGHVLMAWHDRFDRDAGRVRDALARADVSPLGACALAGTSLPIDPAWTAKQLGFSRAFANSIDAVSDRDFAVEFVSACALAATHLSQVAEDLILWSTPEFGFIDLPAELCMTSSIMPQKRNPDMLEIVRGKAPVVTGDLVALLGILKGLPTGYNSDLQETKPPVFRAAAVTRDALNAVRLAVAKMKVHRDAMRHAANDPQILATDLAEYLAARGVPFREAHGKVARLMKACAEEGISPAELPLEALQACAPEFGKDIYKRLTPETSADSRRSPGGTAPSRVRRRTGGSR
jgi:argininosuccinate lyase